MPVFDEDDDALQHYGIIRRSGRYPWGSGGNNDYENATALGEALKDLRGQGLSQADIAKALGYETTNDLRAAISISTIVKKQHQIEQAEKLANTGMSASAIAREMFGSSSKESTVRGLLAPQAARKQNQLEQLSGALRKRVDESSGYIDVGKGVEHLYRVTKTKLDVALAMLKTEGYVVESIQHPNATTQHETRVRVLAKPGETWATIMKNKGLIEPAKIWSDDGGQTAKIWQEPLHLNPARLQVKHKEDGGDLADGVIYIRPGVKDLTMGASSYAQVRIQVGPKHYIKGMAVLKEGLPPGVDVQFHTNKTRDKGKLGALKELDDPTSEPIERFGALFRQITNDRTGKVESHLNIVNDQTDWDDWSKTLATQMLSKQKPDFVQRQLDVTYANRKAQLDEIKALTNPIVKKKLLESYADNMDSAMVHLKAASLPRQKTHVILPVNSLKDNEVYAPGYNNGERVVLIRYPHGGKFEIPELIVNNGNRAARAIIPPDSRTAVGINANVAKKLSGADFDGDTVVVIPNTRKRIQTEPSLEKLRKFDPQEEYRGSPDGGKTMLPGVKKMTNTQTEMGKISNLITDMTIGGASHEELARAVRHSMVVIDAEKHGLNWQKSAQDNAILALKKRYQPGRSHGAATIISRTSAGIRVPDFKRRPQSEGGGTDPKTGEPIYVPTGKTKDKPIKDSSGKVIGWEAAPKTREVERGSRIPGTYIKDPSTGERIPIRDAYDLVSGPATAPRSVRGTIVERHYAEYSNRIRGLANEARKEQLRTKDPKTNDSAKKVYATEVASLRSKLKDAVSNSPRERQAQVLAGTVIKMKRQSEPHITPEQLKRVKTHAIQAMRERVGAKPQRIDITPKEWEAIQNGAIAPAVLRDILANADMDAVKELAQPKTKLLMQPHNVSRAKALMNQGYTRAEIAEELGVSVSTLDRSIA